MPLDHLVVFTMSRGFDNVAKFHDNVVNFFRNVSRFPENVVKSRNFYFSLRGRIQSEGNSVQWKDRGIEFNRMD